MERLSASRVAVLKLIVLHFTLHFVFFPYITVCGSTKARLTIDPPLKLHNMSVWNSLHFITHSECFFFLFQLFQVLVLTLQSEVDEAQQKIVRDLCATVSEDRMILSAS